MFDVSARYRYYELYSVPCIQGSDLVITAANLASQPHMKQGKEAMAVAAHEIIPIPSALSMPRPPVSCMCQTPNKRASHDVMPPLIALFYQRTSNA